jgi:hypothetical protein
MANLILTIFIILAFIALVYLLAKNEKPCANCASECEACFKTRREEEQKMLDSDEMFP